ncbi:hypothetical protein WMY93_031106 [Mugilogobius chulae]|uniref:Uncharacterized protein n=1 Tax=Mugilogobius chulae TaxID=88201 RepID=A0AAW0MDZ5_9GOBI
MSHAFSKEREERMVLIEEELAHVALQDRSSAGDHKTHHEVLREFSRSRFSCRERLERYTRLGLVPVHRDVDSWLYVSEDPQLAVAVEEIVNTFSPALSLELQLYSILGSESDYATCLVRYLVGCYSTNQARLHVKNTLRNMVRWHVLAGFVPCVFLPWAKLRALGECLSSNAAIKTLASPRADAGPWSTAKAYRGKRDRNSAGERIPQRPRARPLLRTLPCGFSLADASREAEQERGAHESALRSLLDVPLTKLPDAFGLLMRNAVPRVRLSIVCKMLREWTDRDVGLKRDTAREMEFKIAAVALWGAIKTLEHGRCPLIPECRASSCVAFYDAETDLVTAAVDGVLYRRVSVCDGSWSSDSLSHSSLAKRAHVAAKNWADLFREMSRGLTAASARHVYTSSGSEGSSLAHLADVVLASRDSQRCAGISAAGNSFDRPLLDNLSRFLTADRPGIFGLSAEELPDVFLRSGVGTTFSEHKAASVSHSLSKMMGSMISDGKNVLLLRRFLSEVTSQPRAALARLAADCKDVGLMRAAEKLAAVVNAGGLSRANDLSPAADRVTDLGNDAKLICNYPCSVTVAHLEETLSMWTNFWRSALSGFSQFSRRHNTIQYNNREGGRELESGSPSHVFHAALVALLNVSGVVFADSLSIRKPDASLTVSEIMLTRDSLQPVAYGLLLSNKLGLRPSDLKSGNDRPEVVSSRIH